MIRPQSEVDAELNQNTFAAAVAEKDEEDSQQEEQNQAVDPELESDEFEIVEGEPEEESPEPDKVDAESNMLGKLVNLLSDKKVEAPVLEVKKRAVPEKVNMEEMEKKFNDKLHETDNPASLVREYAEALVGNSLSQQSLEIQKLKKDALKNDPINKMVFENWDTEVENIISDLPANQQSHPDAYNYAVKQVRDNHFMEILESKVDERLSAKRNPGRTATLGSTGVAPAKKKPKKVYASSRDKAEAKRYGLSLENFLKSRGKI